MKVLFAVATVVAFSVVPAFAADGQVSQKSLAKMGLSGMKAMTDAQGMSVRGLSIAVVTGDSNASINRGTSSDSQFFAAGSGYGYHSAEGSSVSNAGTAVQIGYFHASIVNFAGTAAQASAH